MNKIIMLSMAVVVLLFNSTCKHQPQELPAGNGNNNNNPNPTNDTVYFNTQVLPIIQSSCAMSGCHAAVNPAEGLNLTTYAGIKSVVKSGNANDSKLIKEITRTDNKRMPPLPAAPLDNATIELLKKWINQGANNTICANPCDTVNVKFSTHVQPLIKNTCQGCHNGGAPSAGIALENYTQIKTTVDNGKLWGSINHNSGFSPMPKGMPKFNNCQLRAIEIWITNGAPNN
jgi:hypothetical protein